MRRNGGNAASANRQEIRGRLCEKPDPKSTQRHHPDADSQATILGYLPVGHSRYKRKVYIAMIIPFVMLLQYYVLIGHAWALPVQHANLYYQNIQYINVTIYLFVRRPTSARTSRMFTDTFQLLVKVQNSTMEVCTQHYSFHVATKTTTIMVYHRVQYSISGAPVLVDGKRCQSCCSALKKWSSLSLIHLIKNCLSALKNLPDLFGVYYHIFLPALLEHLETFLGLHIL